MLLGAAAAVFAVGPGAQQLIIEDPRNPLGFAETVDVISTTLTGKGWQMPKVDRSDESMK